MRFRIFTFLLAIAIVTGCAPHKYSIIESEYSYDKSHSGGKKYFSKTPLMINHQTGETFKMTYDKENGYYWQPIHHLDKKRQND